MSKVAWEGTGRLRKFEAQKRAGVEGDLFVGHMVFHADGERRDVSCGDDWDETLLSKRVALDFVRKGLAGDATFREDIARKAARHGTAFFHFFMRPSESGDLARVCDCDPACPKSAEARALLPSTKPPA